MSATIVNTATAPQLGPEGDPGYVDRMVARADGEAAPAEGSNAPADSGLILGKFKSQADLEAAYKALETKLGKPADAPAAEPKAEAPADDKPTELTIPKDDKATTDEATKVVEKAGLDMSSLSSEYAEKGELADESYAKLEKAGIPRDMVDSYIAGQKAIAERLKADVFNLAGGENEYREMIGWAGKNLPADEQTAFNSIAAGGDMAAFRVAVKGLTAQYKAAAGSAPRLLNAEPAVNGSDTYSSWTEIKRDMANPKYDSDPAFRRQVEQKVGRSSI